MADRAIIDTSAWIAYYLSDDKYHSKIKKILKELIANKIVICTSNDIVDETVTRLIYTTNPRIVKKFIDFTRESLRTKNLIELWIDEQLQQEALALTLKFSEHKLSLTDCTTIALLNRFNIGSLVTLDSDFKKVGISVIS